ncbi:MAG: alpha/beta hydrolase [Candidatus Komeilibacteria bacterium]|nr:alpha/beta hydrolase [Candidatus Komeilibacteria bacterium]
MKAYIIHGWDYTPDQNWYPWLAQELEREGIPTVVPAMPDPAKPTIDAWVQKLNEILPAPDPSVVLVGHSIGCQAIMRYLAGLPPTAKVGTIIMVAPWLVLTNLEDEETEQIAAPWLNSDIDFEAVRDKCGQVYCFFSADDPFVPVENADLFLRNLNAHTIVEENKGHYTADEGVTEVKMVRDFLLTEIESPIG